MYRYLDNFRLQLWFDSPNICAAFLDISVLLTIGFFVFLFCYSSRKGKIVAIIVMLPLIILQFILIAQTYSRGGWFALSVVLLLAGLVCRNKTSYILLFLFTICLLLNPNGGRRIYSSTNVQDGSIKHRFLLWKGALGIIAEHPFTGVSNGKIGHYYTAWYQPLWLAEGYATFISDYLTIAGKYGLLALFGYLWLLLMLLYSSAKLYCKCHNPLLLYSIAAVVCYMLCAMFSTIYLHISVYWLFAIIVFILITVAILAIISRKIILTHGVIIPISCIPLLICCGIYLSGLWVNHQLPYRFIDQDNLMIATPRGTAKAKIICILSSDNQNRVAIIRKIIRPLLLEKYAVTAFQITPGLNGFSECEKFLSKAKSFNNDNLPIFIFAGNDVANIVVCRQWDFILSGIIAINLPIDWPWEELSPVKHLTKLQSQLLILKTEGFSYFPEEQDKFHLINSQITLTKVENEAQIVHATNSFILQFLQEN